MTSAEFSEPVFGNEFIQPLDEGIVGQFLGDNGTGSIDQEPVWADAAREVPSADEKSLLDKANNALIVAGAGISLAIEQSPINEALRTNIGLDTLEYTESALAVGGAVAAVTVAIEMVPSTFISLGLHREGGAVQKLKTKLSKKQADKAVDVNDHEETNKSIMSKAADAGANVGIALGLGAGLVTVKKHIQDPEPTLAKDLKNSLKATGIVAGVSGTIGYLVGGGIQNAEKVGLETPAQYVVDYGTDTKFWMGALGVGYAAYFAKKGIDKVMNRNSDSNVSVEAIE